MEANSTSIINTPEYQMDWLENQHILRVRFTHFKQRATMDDYYHNMLTIMTTWESGQPYLILNHIQDTQTFMLSPYARQKSAELADKTPRTVKGRTATVIPPNPLMAFLRFFIEREVNRRIPNVQTRIFFDYDEALLWLKELLP